LEKRRRVNLKKGNHCGKRREGGKGSPFLWERRKKKKEEEYQPFPFSKKHRKDLEGEGEGRSLGCSIN